MFDAYLVEEIQEDNPANEQLEVPWIALVIGVVVHCLSGRHYLEVSNDAR